MSKDSGDLSNRNGSNNWGVFFTADNKAVKIETKLNRFHFKKLSKEEAVIQGRRFFWDNKACSYCNKVDYKYVSTGACTSCSGYRVPKKTKEAIKTRKSIEELKAELELRKIEIDIYDF